MSPRRYSTSRAPIRAPTFEATRSSGFRKREPKQAIPVLDSVLFSAGDEEIRKKAMFALSQLSKDERARRR